MKNELQMIWKYIKEVFNNTLGTVNFILGLSGCITLVLDTTYLNPVFSDEQLNVFIRIFSWTLIGWALIYFILISPYTAWKKLYLAWLKLKGEDNYLQILEMPSFIESIGQKERRILAIRIKNTSNTQSIENVRVTVISVTQNDVKSEKNIDLITEVNGEATIHISPKSTEVFRLGRYKLTGHMGGVYLAPEKETTASPYNKNRLPNGKYILEVRITGTDTMPVVMKYHLDCEVGKNPELRLMAAEEKLS